MKQLIVIILVLNLVQAEKLYDCGSQNTSIKFNENLDIFFYDSDGNLYLGFRINGRVINRINTDYVQIRVYGDAPEFKTLKTERFSYYPSSYEEDSYLYIGDFVDFTSLERDYYKVQINFLDTFDNEVGCAAFYVNQDQLPK